MTSYYVTNSYKFKNDYIHIHTIYLNQFSEYVNNKEQLLIIFPESLTSTNLMMGSSTCKQVNDLYKVMNSHWLYTIKRFHTKRIEYIT